MVISKELTLPKKFLLKQINLETSINWIKMIIRNTYVKIYKGHTKNQPKKRLSAVNKQAKKIAERLNIDDRIEKIQESEAYIAVKNL